MKIIDEGLKDYAEMLARQRAVFGEMVERKRSRMPVANEYLFLVEHNPVVTLGRHARQENLLMPEETLREQGIEVFRIERGGDVTYHGPGQLVAYPVIDLEAHRLGVKDYVNLLEECVIRTISDFGLKGDRVAGASGVWIDTGTSRERKICALGVKCSRYITMHGLALNVNTDIRGFGVINPCGFTDRGVTSMAVELGHDVPIDLVKKRLTDHFVGLLS